MSQQKVVRTKDVMKSNFVALNGRVTVKEAIDELRSQKANTIIINKREGYEHDPYGIVLLSDIAKEVLAKNKSPDRVNIYEIMSKPVISVPPEMDVRHCAQLFDSFGLSVAPVIKSDLVLGIVSYKDLVLHGLYEMSESADPAVE